MALLAKACVSYTQVLIINNVGLLGLYWDKEKENGNYYLGFRVQGCRFFCGRV